MADPTNFDGIPWNPVWLPDDQLGPMVPGLGLPAPIVGAALAAPVPPPPALELPVDFVGPGAVPGAPLSMQPGAELLDPSMEVPAIATTPIDGPVLHPEGVELSPGPVTSPELAPAMPGDEIDGAPITLPGQITGETRPGETPRDAPYDPFADDPLSNPDQIAGQRRLAEIAATNPAQFIEYSNAWQQSRAQHFAREALDAERENQRRIDQNLRDRQDADLASKAKMDTIDADAKALAARPIDPNRWWSSRTTGQQVFAFIGAIAGGIQSGMRGSSGRNEFLDRMQGEIDRDIDAQKATLDNAHRGLQFRKGIVSEEFARTGDSFQAAESARLASYAGVLKQLQAEQMLYDPRGTTAMAYAEKINDWVGRMAAARQAAADKAFDAEMKIREQMRKEADTAAAVRKTLLEGDKLKLEIAKLGGAGGAKKKDERQVLSLDYYQRFFPKAVPPEPMSIVAYEAWLKLKKSGAEATGGEVTLSKEALEHGVSDLKTEDGKPFLAQGTPEEVGKLRAGVAATRTLVRLMDEALAIRTGWTSDLMKSDEWMKLKANWSAAKGVAKEVLGLGALSGPDMELVEEFIGANDPTRLPGIEAGVKKARENVINMTRDKLNANQAHGKVKFDIPYIEPRTPQETAADKAQKSAIRAPSATDVIEAALPRRAKTIDELANEAQYGPKPKPDAKAVMREHGISDEEGTSGQISPAKKAHIDGLAADLKSPDKAKRDKAEAQLVALTGSSNSTVVNYARDVMQDHLLAGQQQTFDQSTGPVTSTVREEAPPRPAKQPNKPAKKGAR